MSDSYSGSSYSESYTGSSYSDSGSYTGSSYSTSSYSSSEEEVRPVVQPSTATHVVEAAPDVVLEEPLPSGPEVRPWERTWAWDELRTSVDDKWTLSSDAGVSEPYDCTHVTALELSHGNV